MASAQRSAARCPILLLLVAFGALALLIPRPAYAQSRQPLNKVEHPEDALLHITLGLALAEKGDLDGAIAEYREAIRLDPEYALLHITLGLALEEKGDLDGAIAEYREAIRLDPEYALAHITLGLALAEKGDVAGAIAEFLKVLVTPLSVMLAVLIAVFFIFLSGKKRTKRRTRHRRVIPAR